MIQLNLLPDIKLKYLKAQRSRRMVVSTSLLVMVAAVVLLILLLAVDLAQKKHLSDLSRDITNETHALEQKKDINNILTVQNQLESLTALHAQKPAVDLLFTNYLEEITPAKVAINSLHVDFTQQTVTISGSADSLATVNQYIDSLKRANYTSGSQKTATQAFSNVVLSSFGLNSGAQTSGQNASFTISLSYDKTIFDITQKVNLTVPSQVSSYSQLSQPGALFQSAPGTSGSGAKP